jgi:hypothetical protein
VTNGQLGEWNASGLPDGEYTLRIAVYAKHNTEYRVRVHVQNSAPIEPTATATEVAPLPTAVPPTDTPTPEPAEATPTETPTQTP